LSRQAAEQEQQELKDILQRKQPPQNSDPNSDQKQ